MTKSAQTKTTSAAPARWARCVAGLLVCLASAGWRDPFAFKVNDGNRLYRAKKYDDALGRYADAESNAPDAPVLFFNMGAAQYRKGKFDDAVKLFQKASASPKADLGLRAMANYNIGNCLVRQQKYAAAFERFKTAIDLTQTKQGDALPGFDKVRADAKFNAEWCQRKLLEQMNRQAANQMPDYLAISPAKPTIIVGEKTTLRAAGYGFGKNKKKDGVNDDGTPKADDVGPIPIEAHWATDLPKSIGKLDERSGEFVAGDTVGKGRVVVEDRAQGRFPLRAAAPIEVVLPDRLEVGPATVTVAAGSRAHFTAQAYTNGPDGIPDPTAKSIKAKQRGKAATPTAFQGDDVGPLPIQVEWRIKSGQGLGKLDPKDGTFVAGSKAGKVVIAAQPAHPSCKGMSKTAEITIVRPDYLRIAPPVMPVPIGGQQAFTARAYSKGPNGKTDGVDPTGKPLGDDYGPLDVEVTWSAKAPADVGKIDAASGVFTAGKTQGKAKITAHATSNSVKLEDATAAALVVKVDYIRIAPAQAKLGLNDRKQFTARGYSNGPNGKTDGLDKKGQPKGDDIGPLPVKVKWSTDLPAASAGIDTKTGLLRSLKQPAKGSVFAATIDSGTILEASAKVQIEDKQKQKKKQKQKQKQRQKQQPRLSKKDAMKLLKMLEEEQRKNRPKRRTTSQSEQVEKDW